VSQGAWLQSSAGPAWLEDDAAACGAADREPFMVDGEAGIPIDPLNDPAKSGAFVWQPDGYVYGYRGYSTTCPNRNGQFFVIAVRLEVLYRDLKRRSVVDCDGNVIPFPREVFALTGHW
jgi:hypothetical protein